MSGLGPVAACAGEPPEACGLEAASGALPVATGAVGGAAGWALVFDDVEAPIEPPPWVPEPAGWGAPPPGGLGWAPAWACAPACGAVAVALAACGLEAASGALPVATGAVGGAAGWDAVFVDVLAETEPPP